MDLIATLARLLLGQGTGERSDLERVREVNLGTAILLALVVFLAYGLLYLALGEQGSATLCFAGSALSFACAVVFRATRSIALARESLLVTIFVLLVCLSYRLGGVRSPALIWLATCPTIAALVGGSTGRRWSLMALFGVLGFYFAPSLGLPLPEVRLTEGGLELLTAVSAVSLAATVALFALLFEATNRAAFRRVRELATHDELTSLPNRRFMREVLETEDRRHRNDEKNFSVALIDIDYFKQINDNYGHGVGDVVLKEFARQALRCLRSHDILSRWGGEEFLLFLPGTDKETASLVVDRLREEILQLRIDEYGASIRISFSAGVAEARPGSEIGEAIKQADMALGVAKSEGRNTVKTFTTEMLAEFDRCKVLKDDIRRGLRKGEFALHYQPQFDCSEKLIGAEALLRWQHPELGLLAPSKFIPLAEEDGLISELGEHVLLEACKRLFEWSLSDETKDLTLSVNVSARQLKSPSFLQQVIAALDATSANPERLTLELTESILLGVTPATLKTVRALAELGLRLSLDDFGTGYSSLNYLKQLPLHELKIDRSFIHNVASEVKDAAIVETIVALGHALRLDIVAEGIETAEQREFLASRGCHRFQGHFFSPAVTLEEFAGLLPGSWVGSP